jgi:hypothetical protein
MWTAMLGYRVDADHHGSETEGNHVNDMMGIGEGSGGLRRVCNADHQEKSVGNGVVYLVFSQMEAFGASEIDSQSDYYLPAQVDSSLVCMAFAIFHRHLYVVPHGL